MSYSDKPWVKHYDQGVAASLAPYPEVPLHYFLRTVAHDQPQQSALLTSARLPIFGRLKASLSYAELDALSDALASVLADLHVSRGDRVALIMPNCAQFAISFWAVLKAGAVVCAINPTYPQSKMQHQISDCGARICITLSLFYKAVKNIQIHTLVEKIIVTNIKDYLPPLASLLFTIVREEKEGHRVQIQSGDLELRDLLAKYAGQKPDVNVSPTDIALYQYTGGTTGTPKAAIATHQALVSNLLQMEAWLGANGTPQSLIGAIPMFHVFGMVAVLAIAAKLSAPIFLIPNPREIKEILEVIHAYRPTIFMGVPAMYNAIINDADVIAGKYGLKSVETCISGSAPLPSLTKQKFEGLTGGTLVEGYGMSEMPTASHVNPLRGDHRTESIGLPLPDVESRIVDLKDGTSDVPFGEIGELVMRGPQMMTGYNNMPDETDFALRLGSDGKRWMYTGDIATMDEDGFFYIIDRKKDMALISGYNVYPHNIEKVLLEHPAVQDVGVAAIPHPDPGKTGQEALKAWVILKPDAVCTEPELVAFTKLHLARYEVPTRIEFVNTLPKSSMGKILRIELIRMETAAQAKRAVPS